MTPVYAPSHLGQRVRLVTLLEEVGALVAGGSAVVAVEAGGETYHIAAPITGYVVAARIAGTDLSSEDEPLLVLDTVDGEDRRAEATKLLDRTARRAAGMDVPDAATPPAELDDPETGSRIRLTPEAAQRIQELHLDPREILGTLVRFRRIPRPQPGLIAQLNEGHIDEYLKTGTELAIIGANDESLVLLDIIFGSAGYSQYAVSIYDDDEHVQGRPHGGVLVVGDTKMLAERDGEGVLGAVAIAARRDVRQRLVEKVYYDTLRAPLVPMLSEAADVSPTADLELACTVCPGAVIGTGARLGLGCYVGYGAVIGAFATLGAFCDIAAGAVIGARAKLGEDVHAHPGAVLGPRQSADKGLDVKGQRVVKRRP